MSLDNDLNQPFVLLCENNENIHNQILDNDIQNYRNLNEKLKFIANTILYRIPILLIADLFYAKSNYFYSIFESYIFFDSSIVFFIIHRLFILIGK